MGENNHHEKKRNLKKKQIWLFSKAEGPPRVRHDAQGKACSVSLAPSVRGLGVPLEAAPVLSLEVGPLLQLQKESYGTGSPHQLVWLQSAYQLVQEWAHDPTPSNESESWDICWNCWERYTLPLLVGPLVWSSLPPKVGEGWRVELGNNTKASRRGKGGDRFLTKFLSTWIQPCLDHPLNIFILWVRMFPGFLQLIWVSSTCNERCSVDWVFKIIPLRKA